MLRIGVDVGGTNTDAVLMDGNRVLADTKSPTTPDVSGGIINAIRTILNTADVDPPLTLPMPSLKENNYSKLAYSGLACLQAPVSPP